MPIDAEDEITVVQARKLKSSNNYSDNASHKSVGLRQLASNNTTPSNDSKSKSQISQFQEAFTNAPMIELGETFSALIAEVYHQTKNCSCNKSDFPYQDTLFYILFRVIISPNAP